MMNKTTTIIIGAIIIVLLLVGGWWFMTQAPAEVPNETNNQNTQLENTENENPDNPLVDVDVEVTTSKTHEVSYTNSGYAPATLTIKAGDTVKFINNSTRATWPASAMHPTHTAYNGTSLQQHCPDAENDDFDACKNIASGASWEFTFTKVGEWAYHDHANAGNFGKIIVQ